MVSPPFERGRYARVRDGSSANSLSQSGLRVAAEVRRHERADRPHREPALAQVVERALDEDVAEPLSLVRRVDLGVDEHDRPVVLTRVTDLAGERRPEPELVAEFVGVVDYARLHAGHA